MTLEHMKVHAQTCALNDLMAILNLFRDKVYSFIYMLQPLIKRLFSVQSI